MLLSMCADACVSVRVWWTKDACIFVCIYECSGNDISWLPKPFCPPTPPNWVACAMRSTPHLYVEQKTHKLHARAQTYTHPWSQPRDAAYRDNDVIEYRDRSDRARAIKPLFFALHTVAHAYAADRTQARHRPQAGPAAVCLPLVTAASSAATRTSLSQRWLSESSLAWVFVQGQTSRDSTP